jgi:hypothetical protein
VRKPKKIRDKALTLLNNSATRRLGLQHFIKLSFEEKSQDETQEHPKEVSWHEILEIRVIFDTLSTGMCVHSFNKNASNNNVKSASFPAHGGITITTRPSAVSTRGTRACKWHSYSKKFRCRHVFSTLSCTGHKTSAPPSSLLIPNRLPRLNSSHMSNRFPSALNPADLTNHGASTPSAALNNFSIPPCYHLPTRKSKERVIRVVYKASRIAGRRRSNPVFLPFLASLDCLTMTENYTHHDTCSTIARFTRCSKIHSRSTTMVAPLAAHPRITEKYNKFRDLALSTFGKMSLRR